MPMLLATNKLVLSLHLSFKFLYLLFFGFLVFLVCVTSINLFVNSLVYGKCVNINVSQALNSPI